MGSVDGRILVGRWSLPYNDTPLGDVSKIYSEIGASLDTDAWTFGKNTITEIFPEKFNASAASATQQEAGVFKAGRTSKRLFIAIDPEADIRYSAGKLRGDDMLVVTGRNATDEYLAFLSNLGISWLVVDDISNLSEVLETVNREFGITSISLQGGGVMNGGMLCQGMVDELSYVVYPGIDATADSVSIFHSSESPASDISLELLSVEKRLYGVVWLRYRIHNAQTLSDHR